MTDMKLRMIGIPNLGGMIVPFSKRLEVLCGRTDSIGYSALLISDTFEYMWGGEDEETRLKTKSVFDRI